MKVLLINECSFESINSIGMDECLKALEILAHILNWQISLQEQQEVKSYINRINQRITYLQQFQTSPIPGANFRN
jgi:hypothetical protein